MCHSLCLLTTRHSSRTCGGRLSGVGTGEAGSSRAEASAGTFFNSPTPARPLFSFYKDQSCPHFFWEIKEPPSTLLSAPPRCCVRRASTRPAYTVSPSPFALPPLAYSKTFPVLAFSKNKRPPQEQLLSALTITSFCRRSPTY